jgi:hypothetical protein
MRDTIYAKSRQLVYSLTSATAHGTHFALMRAYVDNGVTHGGETTLDRRLDHRQIEPICGTVLEAFTASLGRVVRLTNWGRLRIDGYQSAIRSLLYTMPH